ncbi:hypothetical protein B0H16DRAFT_1479638 [Mycena metata]|uniref:Uncharacterized protein n=1 Tax=Mycena metata TaxID=1033252 RepID=A0AAD7H4L6_9AGAR|nr:hypothetical protein B0H16DRAFT_1479638 [Mycena metata]
MELRNYLGPSQEKLADGPTAPPTTSGCPPFSTASQHIRMHAQRDCSSFDRDATLGDATGFLPTGSVYLRTPARCLAVLSRECLSCWLVLRPPLVYNLFLLLLLPKIELDDNM